MKLPGNRCNYARSLHLPHPLQHTQQGGAQLALPIRQRFIDTSPVCEG
jgi:hypothetical protein